MATASLNQATLDLIKKSYPDVTITPTDPAATSSVLYETTYNDAEKNDIVLWTNLSATIEPASDALTQLNNHLQDRTTILGTKPSVADIAIYTKLAPYVKNWSAEERTGEKGFHHVVRHVDFVQNAPTFQLDIAESDKIPIDLDDVKFIFPRTDKGDKEKKKNKKGGEPEAVAAAAGAANSAALPVGASENQKKKKEKKEKAPRKPAPAPVEKPLSPALIDLRVGHILKAIQHPNADSLYVSTIAMGDAPGTDNTSEYEGRIVRTVCSGLNGLVPLEEMQGRKIVCVCNLKPVTMRGIKSSAMVLAASPRPKEGEDAHHGGPVELVNPPADAEAGERVFFEGWEGEPEAVLNPKKKIWEACQPGFTTTDDLEVAFDVGAVDQLKESGKTGLGKLKTKQGLCTVKTLKGATVR
jgi:aminoacyl tRNA synthase complex-interacting multifunctional protein 1